MLMPGRKYSTDKYRYGFNGKENENDVKGEGNQQDYGMRVYDGRIGKFLSVDAITSDYPELTPYQFSSNSPIFCIDLDGLEGRPWYTYDQEYSHMVVDKAPTYYKNVATGFFKSAWNTFKSIAIATTPVITPAKIQQTEAIVQAITNPKQTFNNTKAGIKQWGRNLVSPNPAVAGNAFGQGLEFGAEMLVPGAIAKSTVGINVAKAELNVAATLEKVAPKIGQTGKIGEDFLKSLGGASQKYFYLKNLGKRFVDQFVNGTAYESKVGYTTLTTDIQKQIAKDAALLANSVETGVKRVVWTF